MECPKCNSEVSCLNNTLGGEACYNCRKRLDLKIISYPFEKGPSQKELMEEMKRKNG